MEQWKDFYVSPSENNWQGRGGGRFHEHVRCHSLLNPLPKGKSFALIGFACDEGIRRNLGRVGAVDGPIAFRKSLANLPWNPQPHTLLYDMGDIICHDQNLEATQEALREVISLLHSNQIYTFVIGGGHELSWGHFRGLMNPTCAIVNIDAHFDLRPVSDGNMGNSGTSFFQIAQMQQSQNQEFVYACLGIQEGSNTKDLFDQAKKWKVPFLLADELHQGKQELAFDFLDDLIRKHRAFYVSLCMDVFASPFAPGVSAPQPFGLLPSQVMPLMKKLAKSGKVIGFDIAELSPPLDPSALTVNLAAQVFEIFFKNWNRESLDNGN